MLIGSLIMCSDPPPGVSDETMGVIKAFDGATVTVSWPTGQVKTHSLHKILWAEDEVFKTLKRDEDV